MKTLVTILDTRLATSLHERLDAILESRLLRPILPALATKGAKSLLMLPLVVAFSVLGGCALFSSGKEPTTSVVADTNTFQRRTLKADKGWVVGAYCPTILHGRAAVVPVLGGWSEDVLPEVIERGLVRQFTVLGWRTDIAGVFDVIAPTKIGKRAMAVGGFIGHSPCQYRDNIAEPWKTDSACEKILKTCGVAFARTEAASGLTARPFDESPTPLSTVSRGVGCVARDALFVRDSSEEFFSRFEMAEILSDARDEVLGKPVAEPPCEPAISSRGKNVSILAITDFDNDGNEDVLVSVSNEGGALWSVYEIGGNGRRLSRKASGRVDLVKK